MLPLHSPFHASPCAFTFQLGSNLSYLSPTVAWLYVDSWSLRRTVPHCVRLRRAIILSDAPLMFGLLTYLLTFLFTYLITPCCRVLLETLTGFQLVKKFLAFHGNRSFITALTRVRHVSLFWASPFQSIYPHPTSWRSILILSTHLRLGLPSGLLPSSFPSKTLYTSFYSLTRATCTAHLILLNIRLRYPL